MPRGRHRHSAPLHRLLPPLTVAATSVACAAGALVVGETTVIRGLAVAAAAATVVGSVLTRRWDRAAGRRVAQLTAARTREEWKTEERIAELETEVEETRLARTRMESKLRNKRAELARLRTEHADLLRRYAAAETGRASALEGRRLLAKGKAPAKAKKLELEAAGTSATRSGGTAPDAAAFRRAADALRDLERNAAAQRAAAAAKPEAEPTPVEAKAAKPRTGPGPTPPAAPAPAPAPASMTTPKAVAPAKSPAPAKALAPAKVAVPPAGTAVALPAARRPASRAQGGFDFFGNKKGAPAPKPVDEQDLADVVGEEVLADAQAVRAVGTVEAVESDEVIDLTAHDETEQIDLAELRTAIS
ncbi:hypothetical protein J3S04_13390 [Streptomyces griseocarneus]|uniref:Secreted protein n=1 Tax=Streptomyces griseocarneus TaxID=51201 RepID=A0ABX7RW62_9ACTN|nr:MULTISPECIES: hypothetical protein [Streptomyces]QSY51763.1 hypothetical protein J3S04_13390 [Streptomyces griseocarneus]